MALPRTSRPAPEVAQIPLVGGAIWDVLRNPNAKGLARLPTKQLVDELLPMAERHAPGAIAAIRDVLSRRGLPPEV